MGSFNTTCFASQQTITPGAEVYIFPIHQQATYSVMEIVSPDGQKTSQAVPSHSTCHPTSFWTYAGPFIRGTYYDYGRFQLTDSPQNIHNLNLFFNYLHKNVYDTTLGENKYHNLGLNFRKIFNPSVEYIFEEMKEIWDRLFEVVSENRVFVQIQVDDTFVPRNLQFAVMHAVTAEYLMGITSKFKSWDSKKNYGTPNEFFDGLLEKIFKRGYWYYNYIELEDIRPSDWFPSYIYKNRFPDSDDKHPVTLDELKNLFSTFEDEIIHRYIHFGLDSLNIKISPMVYTGQDYDNSIGKQYLRMIRSVNTEIKKNINQQNEKYGD